MTHQYNRGLIKVDQKFSLSISGSFFSGLDPNIYSGFKPEINFLYQFRVFLNNCINFSFSQQLLIVSFWFPTMLSSQTLLFGSAI